MAVSIQEIKGSSDSTPDNGLSARTKINSNFKNLANAILSINVEDENIIETGIVYPESYGTDGVNDQVAINLAIDDAFNHGYIVKLLPKNYIISSPVLMKSGVRLIGTSVGRYDRNLERGTRIIGNGLSTIISAHGSNDISGCLQFEISNLTIKANGASSNGITFSSTNNLVPRDFIIKNVFFEQCTGYALKLDCFSYGTFENINIWGGKGVIITNDILVSTYREFGWFKRIYINGCSNTSFEINAGNNLYIENLDVNDSLKGLYINALNDIYNVFFNNINCVRCNTSIDMYAYNRYLNRISFDGVTICPNSVINNANIYFHRNNSYNLSQITFNKVNIEIDNQTDQYDIYGDNIIYSEFTNIRCYKKVLLTDTCKFLLNTIPQSGKSFISGNGSNKLFVINISNNSKFWANPEIAVNTNQKIPFAVYVINTINGNCQIQVDFLTAPDVGNGNVQISYMLTGYYS